MAHYLVACDSRTQIESSRSARPVGGWGWLGKIFGRRPAPAADGQPIRHYIVGFVGFWIMAGEAHITSIAVREEYRRRGVGEVLLAASLDLAGEMGADVVTLEVRASNAAAQQLYRKYGFNRVGERKAYYLDRGPSGDTREDAFIMTTDEIRSDSFQARLRKLKEGLVTR
jgi:ribosomal-protein-alanine N-acetyltransferase